MNIFTKHKKMSCVILFGLISIIITQAYVRHSAKNDWQDQIYESIDNNNLKHLNELLSQGVKRNFSLDFFVKKDYTPLILAITKEKEEIVSSLLKYGANPNFKDKSGMAPLYKATFCYENNDIPFLLIKHGADLKKSVFFDKKSNTYISVFLHAVAYGKNLKFIEYLLQQGENPNLSGSEYGELWSLLYLACMNGNTDLIKLLIKHGADPNKPNEKLSQWYLFLIISYPGIIEKEKIDLLKLFFKHDAKVKPIPILNNGTNNILQYARKKCSKEIIELLEKNLETKKAPTQK